MQRTMPSVFGLMRGWCPGLAERKSFGELVQLKAGFHDTADGWKVGIIDLVTTCPHGLAHQTEIGDRRGVTMAKSAGLGIIRQQCLTDRQPFPKPVTDPGIARIFI